MSLARLKSRVFFFLPEKNSINIFSLLACFKFERHIVKIARVMKVSLGRQWNAVGKRIRENFCPQRIPLSPTPHRVVQGASVPQLPLLHWHWAWELERGEGHSPREQAGATSPLGGTASLIYWVISLHGILSIDVTQVNLNGILHSNTYPFLQRRYTDIRHRWVKIYIKDCAF
jgi:hypothetical protein